MAPRATSDILAEIARLDRLIAEHAEAAERERRIAAPVVEAMGRAGAFHMLVPRSIGGGEVHPAMMLAVLEHIAAIDASTSWLAMIAATSALTSAYVDETAARDVFGGGPGVFVAGITAPRGKAALTPEGYRLSGRWPFGSGCEHSQWIALAAMLEGDRHDAVFMLVPTSEVEIIDTWDVAGLRATGSHDIAVNDVLVPAGRGYFFLSAAPRHPGPLYGFSVMGLLAIAVASVALGIGRGALNDFLALAPAKVPTGRRRATSDWNVAQTEYAQAEGALRAGRAFLVEAIDSMWRTLESGGQPTEEQRALVRLAATTATQGAVRAVDMAYNFGGGSSIYSTNVLQRRFRDIHTLTQHLMVSPSSLEAAGRSLLGLTVPPGFL